jgi:hypothetical protein
MTKTVPNKLRLEIKAIRGIGGFDGEATGQQAIRALQRAYNWYIVKRVLLTALAVALLAFGAAIPLGRAALAVLGIR